MINESPISRWRKLTRFLLGFSIVTLVLFNAYAAIGKHFMSLSIERTITEIETRREQLEELSTLQRRYFNEYVPKFEEIETVVRQIHQTLHDEDQLFPILDHEFVVTSTDGESRSGKRTINVTAPKTGTHRLRIQIAFRNKQLHDTQFDLATGQRHRIKFSLQDNSLRLLYPQQEPADIELDNFESANHISSLRSTINGQQLFVSCNQPRWRFTSQSVTAEHGELARFAYLSNSFEPQDHVTILISAKSDGPPSAAVDDPATVLYLMDLLASGFETPEYRYEDGRYFFEEFN